MSDTKVLDGLYYTNEHEWLKVDGDTAIVGITDHAQHALGDLVFVELPAVGKSVSQHAAFAVVESVKAASEVYAPATGEVLEVNSALEGAPETINDDAYGKGWIAKMKLTKQDELSSMMDAAAYKAFIADL